MAFALKRNESVRKGIHRLSRKSLENAIDELRARDQLEAIHSVRKEIKKVRALLRLVRVEIGRNLYRKRSEPLREGANLLAAARDAHVKLVAVECLIDHFKSELSPRSFDTVRRALRRDCRKEISQFKKEGWARAVSALLEAEIGKLEGLPIKAKGWSAIGPGIQRTYAAGRQMQQLVRREASAENFHEWRKRVKDLWYYSQLLEPIWPEQMSAVAQELEKLGEYLGDDHDLHLLKLTVAEKPMAAGAEKEVEALVGLIDLRQAALRDAALTRARRFFADKPTVFCARLRQYWKVWRGLKKETVGGRRS